MHRPLKSGCYLDFSANGSVDHRPGDFVRSEKGKKMQQQVWGEIVDELKTKVPGVEQLAA